MNILKFKKSENDSLENLMNRYKIIHARIKEDLSELEGLKLSISFKVKESKENAFYDNVSAIYKDSYTRISWETKKLEGYLIDHPELKTFRKEIFVNPSVTLKVQ